MRYRHLFGPVPSRRLGRSLGIDLTPGRQCSLNCVYCECGSTSGLTLERREYVPTSEVLAELRDYLAGGPELDSVTFSGSGEPTLHSGVGEIIRMLKDEFPAYTVTMLTNSTLLHRADVRTDLLPCDRVVPSLDAVSDEVFRKVNRPFPELTAQMLIDGLQQFRHEFRGELWLEIFIIPGVNDDEAELSRLRSVARQLDADRIQLNSLDRPGAVRWVEGMPFEKLRAIAAGFGPDAEAISRPVTRHAMPAYEDDIQARILQTVRVRPCTIDDLADMLGMHQLEVGKYLDVMVAESLLEVRSQSRGVFYSAGKR
jgi:wyosine [tRNA(Phe)-imidazoG37] synthetase (radical SAM superfamily)